MPRVSFWLKFASAVSAGIVLLGEVAAGPIRNPFQPTSVQRLAESIDWLEKHVDEYGTVVAKTPDVWGEERLTRHRFEYEAQLARELSNFKGTINAQIARSDQAFLATAAAIATISEGKSRENSAWSLLGDAKIVRHESNAPPDFGQFLPNPSTSGASTNVALEPVIFLDQLSRYTNHLHELRRVNEGDDTALLPGYALNLVRIPVSLVPGRKTRMGHGAEVTVTASPWTGDELLPTSFQSLAINDLVDQIGLPLTDALNDAELAAPDRIRIGQILSNALFAHKIPISDSQWWYQEFSTPDSLTVYDDMWFDFVCALWKWKPETLKSVIADDETFEKLDQALRCLELKQRNPDDKAATECLEKLSKSANSPASEKTPRGNSLRPPSPAHGPPTNDVSRDAKDSIEGIAQRFPLMLKYFSEIVLAEMDGVVVERVRTELKKRLKTAIISKSVATTIRLGRAANRNGQSPIPLSHFSAVYGQHIILQILLDAYERVAAGARGESVHFHVVQDYLREELEAAHALLKRPENHGLWGLCTPELVTAVRNRDFIRLQELRCQFFNLLNRGAQDWSTGSYAWALLVEAALLNDRLIDDMRDTGSAKRCPCVVHNGAWMDFYSPTPSADARMMFNEYVRCRWPIHVFALDPQTQDQNVGDSFSRTRELQLSISVALAMGMISVDQATKFARRLETDMQTVALNRTVVAFSHGDDTFGWRFYPRVQTPPIESNATVAFRDLLIGGPSRDQERSKWELEAGQRECVALVLAPAFVRQLQFDTRSNWFRLDNPKKAKLTLDNTLELSKAVKTMQCLSEVCLEDAHQYREGEIHRLQRRVHQLSTKLPLQTLNSEMPVDLREGGFRLCSAGANFDRSPQLYSWYGSPGVHLDRETTVFLIGDNFRLQSLRVIAGNRPLEYRLGKTPDTPEKPIGSVNLLSPQVLEVTLPPGLATVRRRTPDGRDKDFIDVHIASYHGVSQHLLIDVWDGGTALQDAIKKTAADAAKEATTVAIAKHSAVAVTWNGKDVQIPSQVDYIAGDKRLARFVILDDAKLAFNAEKTVPFSALRPNEGDKASIAFFVVPVSKIAAEKFDRFSIGPYSLDVNGQVSLKVLEQKLRDRLVNATFLAPNGLKELQLTAFIRFDEDTRPVLKLDDPLIIPIQERNAPFTEQCGKCIVPAAAIPSAAGPTIGSRPSLSKSASSSSYLLQAGREGISSGNR